MSNIGYFVGSWILAPLFFGVIYALVKRYALNDKKENFGSNTIFGAGISLLIRIFLPVALDYWDVFISIFQ